MAEGFDQTKGMVVGLRVQSEPQATRKTFVGDLLKRINYQVRQVRSELRFPRELPVEVEVHGAGRALGRTLDISAGGAKLELPDSFQTPCNATVTLDMSDGKAGGRRLTLSSRLLRSTVDNEGRNCYAVAFRKGQPRELLELSRWLAGQMRVQNLDELIPNFSSAEGLQ